MINTANPQNIDPILGFDPWFLRPPKEAQEIKHSDHYIKHNEKKKGNRKVYQKVQYDEFEKQHIEILQQEMEKQQIQVPADWKTSDYLKMCYSGRFDLKKDIKAAKLHIEWRNNQIMHTLDDKARKLLESGMAYLLGRDNQFRPIVYLDCTKINIKKEGEQTILRSMCVFLDMIKKFMFLDYHIENWVMVIDTGGLGLSSLPISGLQLIIGSMSINYCATMDKMYILNPSFVLRTSWSIIKGFMDPDSVEKISVLEPKKYKEMQQKIPIKYLQKKHGGEHEDITQYWPPLNVYCSEDERHKILKNQPASAIRRPSKVLDKQIIINQSIDSKDGSGQKQNNNPLEELKNKGLSQGSNQFRDNSVSIKNDGIKPKINIIKVLDDKIDDRFAKAGYDEELEKKLREEQQRQNEIQQQQKKNSKDLSQSQSQVAGKKRVQVNSQNMASSQTNTQGNQQNVNNYNNTTNMNAASTDFSEINNQSPQVVPKNKIYNSPLPEIVDTNQEFSANLNNEQKRLLNQQDTEFQIENNNTQENPIANSNREEVVDSSKCCQHCTIF